MKEEMGDDIMKLFESILIATDGSAKNKEAIEVGLNIARAYGSKVWAIYVIDTGLSSPIQYSTALACPGIPDVIMDLDDEAKQASDRVRAIAGDVPVTIVVREGKPAPEIIRFATEKKADLIVIGSRGKGGFERLLLGSVADEVVRAAHGNVLVVKG